MNHIYNSTRARGILCLLLTIVLLFTAALFPPSAMAVEKFSGIDGKAAILVDANTGTVLYEQNADQPVPPASTTKILTALLVVEAIERGQISAGDMVELTDAILHDVPSDASRIQRAMVVGEQVSVSDLLLLALMESDCVACDMLAVHVSGSVEKFIELMNLRATQLGCRDTVFKNSHGYPTEGHVATARSLYLITREAAKYEMFMDAFSCLKYSMQPTNKNDARTLYSTDKLLYNPEIVTSSYTVYYRDYVTGGKTGFSRASGNCLVSTAEKDGMELISVITGVEIKYPDEQTVIDAFTETDRLLVWGFDNYRSHVILNSGQVVRQVEVEKGVPEVIDAVCADTIYVTLEKGISTDTVQVVNNLGEEAIPAPVSAGDVLGTVSVMSDGRILTTTSLIAGADSAVAPKRFQPNIPVIIILSVLVAAGAAYLVYYTNNNKVLLLDVARELINGKEAAAAKAPAQKKPSHSNGQERKPVPEEQEDPFEELFARYGKDE